jgi:type II secretory pathway component PulF
MTTAAHRHWLYTELAKLLHAGFPIERAADTLLKQQPAEPRRRTLEALKQGLGRHQTIAESLRGSVSDLEFSLLDAAERGGRLGDGCEHLADYFSLLEETRRRFLRRLIYPALLLHLVFLPGALPKLVIEGPNAFLAALIVPLSCLYGAAALVVGLGLWLVRTARTNPGIDRLLNVVPVLGWVRRSLAFSRFCKVFQISLLAGRRISDALEMSAMAAQSAALSTAAQRLVPEVEAGEALGPLLQTSSVFPTDMASGFATAEEAGTLDREAARWAAFYRVEAQAATDAFATWAARIIYGIAVVAVAWVVLRFWLNYFQTIGGMLNAE